MQILVKIDKKWFLMDRFNFTLTETEAPESPENAEFFNGSKLAKYMESVDLQEAIDKYNERVRAWNKAKQEAKSNEELAAVAADKPELAVLKHALEIKKQAHAELEADLPEEDKEEAKKEEDAKPADDGEGDDAKPQEPAADDKTDGAEQPVTPPPADGGTGQTPPPEGGTPETGEASEETKKDAIDADVTVSDEDLAKLLEDEKASELVQMAAAIVKSNKKEQQFNNTLNNLPSRGGVIVEPAPMDRAALKRSKAEFMTAGAGLQSGETLDNSDEMWGYLQESFNRAFFSGNTAGVGKQPIGSFKELTGPIVADASGNANSHFTRGDNKHLAPPLTMTASGEICDVEDRKTLVTRDDLGYDLTGMFQTLASDSCKLRFRKDISMWKLAPGITYWDKQRYADYCSARDDLADTIAAAATPPTTAELNDIAAKRAALEVLQKRCADVGCFDWSDYVTMEDIVACINYSKRQEQCSQDEIRRHIELLEKLYLRARNAHLLHFIEQQSVIVNVDACVSFPGLDAATVVDEVVNNITGVTDERERRTTSNNWVGLSRDRFMEYLSSGERRRSTERESSSYSKSSIAGLQNVVTYIDELPTANGSGGFDLVQEPAPGIGELPNPGDTLDYEADFQYPKTWSLYVLDPAGGFALRKPDTRLSAQMTHDSAKGNWVNGPFMETTVGYGKDSSEPWYKINFTNLDNNGSKVGPMAPRTICTP